MARKVNSLSPFAVATSQPLPELDTTIVSGPPSVTVDPTATFTFLGQKIGEFPDLPPLETAEVEVTTSGEAAPIEGPDDTEGPTDVPRAE